TLFRSPLLNPHGSHVSVTYRRCSAVPNTYNWQQHTPNITIKYWIYLPKNCAWLIQNSRPSQANLVVTIYLEKSFPVFVLENSSSPIASPILIGLLACQLATKSITPGSNNRTTVEPNRN